MTERRIPVLTDLVAGPSEAAAPSTVVTDEELRELQSRIATEGYALIERLLQESLREMEANLFADVIGRLRLELPDLVEEILQEHFEGASGTNPR